MHNCRTDNKLSLVKLIAPSSALVGIIDSTQQKRPRLCRGVPFQKRETMERQSIKCGLLLDLCLFSAIAVAQERRMERWNSYSFSSRVVVCISGSGVYIWGIDFPEVCSRVPRRVFVGKRAKNLTESAAVVSYASAFVLVVPTELVLDPPRCNRFADLVVCFQFRQSDWVKVPDAIRPTATFILMVGKKRREDQIGSVGIVLPFLASRWQRQNIRFTRIANPLEESNKYRFREFHHLVSCLYDGICQGLELLDLVRRTAGYLLRIEQHVIELLTCGGIGGLITGNQKGRQITIELSLWREEQSQATPSYCSKARRVRYPNGSEWHRVESANHRPGSVGRQQNHRLQPPFTRLPTAFLSRNIGSQSLAYRLQLSLILTAEFLAEVTNSATALPPREGLSSPPFFAAERARLSLSRDTYHESTCHANAHHPKF